MRYPGRRDWPWDLVFSLRVQDTLPFLRLSAGYSWKSQRKRKDYTKGGGRHKKLYTPAAITFFQQHSQIRKPFASSQNTTDVRRKVPLKISLRAPIIITSYVQSSLAAVGCYTFMFCTSKLSRVKRDAKGKRNSNSVHCLAACQLPKCCKASLTHL